MEQARKLLQKPKEKAPIVPQYDQSVFRKKDSYRTWDCTECNHPWYYRIARCPTCGSNKIEELEHAVMR